MVIHFIWNYARVVLEGPACELARGFLFVPDSTGFWIRKYGDLCFPQPGDSTFFRCERFHRLRCVESIREVG